jgi:hypothetical protein
VKKDYGYPAAFLSLSLLAFTNFYIYNSEAILTDIPSLGLLCGAFYFLTNKKTAAWSGIFLSLSILMKFTAIVLIPVFVYSILLFKYNKKEISYFILGGFVTFLPYIIYSTFWLGGPLNPFILGMGMVTDKNEGFLFYIANMIPKIGYLSFLGFAIWWIFAIKYKKIQDKEKIYIFWIILYLTYISLTSHKEIRYSLPLLMPLTILSSIGFYKLSQLFKYKKTILFALAIISIIIISPTIIRKVSHMNTYYDPSDEIMMSNYINSLYYSEILYTNTNWPVFAYYTNKTIIVVWPQDEEFYSEYKKVMTNEGYFVISKYKHPTINDINNMSEFSFLYNKGDNYIYFYQPNNI